MRWWWDYKNFRNSYGLHSLNKNPTCYKHSEISSCIDLILTNKTKSFQSACALETGSSDCYRMIISVIKMHFRKLPQVISYRGFKKFENARFMNSLQSALKSQDNESVKNPHLSFNICQKVLNHHAPRKKVHTRE